jgi:hypothetical protein
MAIDSYGAGVLLVMFTVALAVGGLYLFRRAINIEKLRESHEVAGYLLAIVGTMYAVLLGLVVVEALAKFQEARNNVQAEANSLADVFLLSERFAPDKEKKIKDLCLHYAQRVVNFEWKDMDDCKVDMESRRTAIKLMRAVEELEPKTQSEQGLYPIAVQEICQMWDCRRTRMNSAQNGVPFEEWMVLLVGAFVTVVFTYFFALKNIGLQIAMTCMVSVLIALNLLLVLWFGYPFSGDRKVHPDAFQIDQQIFENQLGNHADIERNET